MPEKSLIVQSNMTVLLDVHTPDAEAAREALLPFTELEKSPEHIHTYRISPLSLWNAASAGLSPGAIVEALAAHSRYELPSGLAEKITSITSRFGKLTLVQSGDDDRTLLLESADPLISAEIETSRVLLKYLTPLSDERGGGLTPSPAAIRSRSNTGAR